MSHGQDHEHEHRHLEEVYEAFLAANTAWRVALRVHLEEWHGIVPGPGVDPQVMHDLQHPGGGD